MKKNNIIKIALVCLITLYCISVFIVKTTSIIELSSVATALFTGIAVLWACHSFKKQQESLKKQQDGLIRQFNLNVFSESIRLLMNSTTYNQGRDYIYSNEYDKDLDLVRKVLSKSSSAPVGLNDFKQILDKELMGKKGYHMNSDEESRLRDSYAKIRFFCMRMEYLGVLSKEEAALNLILEYYGYTIETTYEKLKKLIEETREDPSTAELYSHYTQLYNLYVKNKDSKKNNQIINN